MPIPKHDAPKKFPQCEIHIAHSGTELELLRTSTTYKPIYFNMVSDWKVLASEKKDAILNSIPAKWRVEKLPSNKEQKDVTGSFIQHFLSKREVEITETDVVGIAKATSTGTWTATEVTEAFCHRASLAHQLVGREGGLTIAPTIADFIRQTASTRHFSMLPSPMLKPLTSTTRRTRNPLDHSMACLSV